MLLDRNKEILASSLQRVTGNDEYKLELDIQDRLEHIHFGVINIYTTPESIHYSVAKVFIYPDLIHIITLENECIQFFMGPDEDTIADNSLFRIYRQGVLLFNMLKILKEVGISATCDPAGVISVLSDYKPHYIMPRDAIKAIGLENSENDFKILEYLYDDFIRDFF